LQGIIARFVVVHWRGRRVSGEEEKAHEGRGDRVPLKILGEGMSRGTKGYWGGRVGGKTRA